MTTANSALCCSVGRARRVLLAGACLLGAAACAPEIPPPKAQPAPAAGAAGDAAAATADDAQSVMYAYSPVGKRDPFRDPGTIPKAGRPQGDITKLTPLQLFEIDQLALVFTKTADSTPLAALQDPAGKVHLVQIGDFVGKNWGKVSAIKRDEITITETTVDQLSQRVFPVYIPLHMSITDAEKQAAANMEWKIAGAETAEGSAPSTPH